MKERALDVLEVMAYGTLAYLMLLTIFGILRYVGAS